MPPTALHFWACIVASGVIQRSLFFTTILTIVPHLFVAINNLVSPFNQLIM